MTEGKMPEEEKRQAVIVGINKYEDPDISELEGAENDAKDIYERLKDHHIGNFEIPDDHYLTGKKATCKRIRKAISDLLWQTDPSDLALFYFSGHGFRDGYQNGYIAPFDMSKSEPFVNGINMRELKQVMLDSIDRSIVLIILDCCHSGIPTNGDKAISDVKELYGRYFENVPEEKRGKGKIILASSEADQASKEITRAHEIKKQEPHPHGAFTFYLIEGLDGKASDEDGIITLSKLNAYVENQLSKQKPKFFAVGVSFMNVIKIAIAPQTVAKKIEEIMERVKTAYDINKNHLDRTFAVDDISKVLKIAPTHKEACAIKEELDQSLSAFQKSVVISWWLENQFDVTRGIRILTPDIPKVFSVLENIVNDQSFGKIAALDNRTKSLFVALCKVSNGEIDNKAFIQQCLQYDNPPSTPKPITVRPNTHRGSRSL
jgi:hypothetical protein